MFNATSPTVQTISDNQFRQNLADIVEYYQELIKQGRGVRFNGQDIADLKISELFSVEPHRVYEDTEVLLFFEAVGT